MPSHVFKEGIEGGLFNGTERINLAVVFRDGIRFQFNRMIPLSEGW